MSDDSSSEEHQPRGPFDSGLPPPFHEEAFDESTPLSVFLSSIGLGFLEKTFAGCRLKDGAGISTLGELLSVNRDKLFNIISDKAVVEKLWKHLDMERSQNSDEDWVDKMVDSNL